MATFLDALNSQKYIGFYENTTEHYQGAVLDSEITPIGMYHAPRLPGQDYQYPTIITKVYPDGFVTQQRQLDPRFTPTTRSRTAPRIKPPVALASTPQAPLPYIKNGEQIFVTKK
jgi:hypothetical protein